MIHEVAAELGKCIAQPEFLHADGIEQQSSVLDAAGCQHVVLGAGSEAFAVKAGDLVRAHDPFYNESNRYADTEACIALLRQRDFGFVHQVLAFTRQRPGSLMVMAKSTNTLLAATLFELTRYGPDFLTAEELRTCVQDRLSEYYNFLAVNLILGRRDAKF